MHGHLQPLALGLDVLLIGRQLLERRVLFHLLRDEGLEIRALDLQDLDRVLELRRDDQGLLETGRQAHLGLECHVSSLPLVLAWYIAVSASRNS